MVALTDQKNDTLLLTFVIDTATRNWTAVSHQKDDLSTIDSVALASLKEDMDIFPLPPETPMVPTPHTASTPTIQSFHEVTEAQVGNELIGHCITPRKLTVVKNILQCEQHKYSLKLLPYIFTRETSSSNTEGTHKKLSLDTTKMNSLKVLVFNRFLVESHVEKEKLWNSINGKIDAVIQYPYCKAYSW